MKKLGKIRIIVDMCYHRSQFDDWLAGGRFELKGKTYYWSAQDNNYGFGWEIEPIAEDDCSDIVERKYSKIIELIERCLYEHRTEYVF
jgi:hypothetical protein